MFLFLLFKLTMSQYFLVSQVEIVRVNFHCCYSCSLPAPRTHLVVIEFFHFPLIMCLYFLVFLVFALILAYIIFWMAGFNSLTWLYNHYFFVFFISYLPYYQNCFSRKWILVASPPALGIYTHCHACRAGAQGGMKPCFPGSCRVWEPCTIEPLSCKFSGFFMVSLLARHAFPSAAGLPYSSRLCLLWGSSHVTSPNSF